eukprot:TRINITY_DN23778_c0_g1_i1.p1 TRINITY_DN23778_c0_g1~~TRINITY_DN23778_c0_g1_i1.p1  ORF type:complete len:1381 (+),score=440.98 TRINITY_DN23778_c0_g1_i1:53-4144(+)
MEALELQAIEATERENRKRVVAFWEEGVMAMRGDMIAELAAVSDEEEDRGREEVSVEQVNVLMDKTYDVPPYVEDDEEVVLADLSESIKYYIGLLAVHVLLPTRESAPEILGGILESLSLPDTVIDGLLHLCDDADAHELERERVQLAASNIPITQRLGIIVAIAATGLQSGTYDARLRWGLHRVATILKVPWSRVAFAEGILATTLIDKAHNSSPTHVAKGKGSSYRWLKVGAGVTLGAGVLVITGGLAAPFVAAAATTLASTTATIATAAGLTTVATAIGTTAASLGTVMTVPVITALFGAAGAGLTGLKVYRRTAGVDEFVCKSIRDIELPPWIVTNPCRTLACDRGPGILVHLAVRATTLCNMADKIDTDRKVCFAVEHQVQELGDLHLLASRLEHGEWTYKPPKVLTHGMAAVGAAQKTRFGMRVQGCLVYGTAEGDVQVMCAFECPVVGAWHHRIMHGKDLCSDVEGNMAKCMEKTLDWEQMYIGSEKKTSVMLTAAGNAEAVFSIDSRQTDIEAQAVSTEDKTILINETMTRLRAESFRYAMYVTLLNLVEESVTVLDTLMDYGCVSSTHQFPVIIPSGMVGVSGIHNKRMRPTGAKGFTIYMGQRFSLCLAYSCPIAGGNKASAIIVEGHVSIGEVSKLFKDGLTSEGNVSWLDEEGGKQYVVAWEVTKEGVDFTFREVISAQGNLNEVAGLHVVIGVSGMTLHDDPRVRRTELEDCMWLPVLGADLGNLGLDGADPYFVSWEKELQAGFGKFMSVPTDYGTVVRSAANRGATEAMKNPVVAGAAGLTGAAYAAAATMWASLAWPYYAVQAADIIDSTYVMLNKKSKEAGTLLASMLLEKAQGGRPVTLIGVALGANVVFHALVALAAAADGAGYGLVESAILIGATVPVKANRWHVARSVVAGRLINVYSGHDWFLAFLHRGATVSLRAVAGLSKVSVKGVENVSVNHLVRDTSDYVRKLSEVLGCIPPWPTVQTLCNNTSVPGKITTVDEADEELEIMAASSLAANFLAICVRNKSEVTLRLKACEFVSGMWEVNPNEDAVFPNHAITMAACSQSSLQTAIQALLVFETDDDFDLIVAFKCPAYGEAEVLADMFPTDSAPSMEDIVSKLTVEAGKGYHEDHVVRYERVGNKLGVTLRLSDSVPMRSDITSPKNMQVDAGSIVPVACTATLTNLLNNTFSSSDLGIAVRNKTPLQLVYCWSYVRYGGVWRMTPPPEIPENQAGLAVCSGGIRRGIRGVLCYALEDRFAILLAFSVPLISSVGIFAAKVPLEEAGDEAAEHALEQLKPSGARSTWIHGTDGYKLSWKLLPGSETKMFFTLHQIDPSKVMVKRNSSIIIDRRAADPAQPATPKNVA